MAKLKIAPRVTRTHGDIFADTWIEESTRGGSDGKAFGATGLVEWPPDATLNRNLAAQGRYMDLEDEIVQGTFAAVKDAVADAFVKVARQVLARERRRPNG